MWSLPPRRIRLLTAFILAGVLAAGVAALLAGAGRTGARRAAIGGRGAELRRAEFPRRARGVCWEGDGRIGIEDLRPVRDLGADWISQTPFGWSPGVDSPEIHLASDRVWWGESDSGLVRTAELARSLGIHTLLKPHLWVRHGQWTGDIAMQTEADWQAWFAAYQQWILHYAGLAEEQGMEALAVGTELGGTTARTADWRRIIASVRAVYHGSITYCANWSEEADRIAFWDALDFIGVQAYYPMAQSDHPTLEEVRAAWPPVVAGLERFAKRTGKQIVFTEVGYKSVTGGLREPWRWDADGDPDLELQRVAYTALFEAVWGKPWFGGTFVWKWHPHPGGRRAERRARDFTPQGKPALEVIRSWYTVGDP